LVFGASVDKDVPGMARHFGRAAVRVYLASSRHPRAAPTRQLRLAFAGHEAKLVGAGTVAAALHRALADAKPREVICATGSLFVAAEARETLAVASPMGSEGMSYAR